MWQHFDVLLQLRAHGIPIHQCGHEFVTDSESERHSQREGEGGRESDREFTRAHGIHTRALLPCLAREA
jgi:hypothetical protein